MVKTPIRWLIVGCLSLLVSGAAHAMADAEPSLPSSCPPPSVTHNPVLTLNDAILLSLRYNPSVQSENLQRVIDKFSLRMAEHNYELQYALTANTQYTANTAQGVPTTFQATSGLQQTTTLNNSVGTQFALQANQNGNGNHFSPSVTFSVTQPLLQGFGRDVNLAPLHNAQDAEILSRLTVKNTMAQTITTVLQDYRAVMLAENQLAIQKMTVTNDQKTLDQVNLQIKAGVKAPADAVQAQAALTTDQLQVKQSEFAVIQAKQTLLTDIGIDPRRPIEIVPEINTDSIGVPDLQENLKIGLMNNYNFQGALIAQRENERNFMVAKDKQRWQVNVVSSVSTSHASGNNTPGAGPQNLYWGNGSANFQVQASIPIDNYGLKQQLLQAQIAIRQQEIVIAKTQRDFETQVINSINNLKISKQQIEIAKQSRDFAKKSLEMAKIKLLYGRVAMFEVTSLQNQLTTAEISVITSQINFLNALAQLHYLLGTTLNVWHINVRNT